MEEYLELASSIQLICRDGKRLSAVKIRLIFRKALAWILSTLGTLMTHKHPSCCGECGVAASTHLLLLPTPQFWTHSLCRRHYMVASPPCPHICHASSSQGGGGTTLASSPSPPTCSSALSAPLTPSGSRQQSQGTSPLASLRIGGDKRG